MTAGGKIPHPRDDDDGDVAWNLQTASVQWDRGSFADAIVWLRRAVDAAIEAGDKDRASELNGAASTLTEDMLTDAGRRSAHDIDPNPEAPGGLEVDDLLDGLPPDAEQVSAGMDVDVDEPGRGDLLSGDLASNPFLQRDPAPADESSLVASVDVASVQPEMEVDLDMPLPGPMSDPAISEPTHLEIASEPPSGEPYSVQPDELEVDLPPSQSVDGVASPTPERPSPPGAPPSRPPPPPPPRPKAPSQVKVEAEEAAAELAAREVSDAEPPAPPAPSDASAEPAPEFEAEESPEDASVGGVSLAEVRGFEDLPEDAQGELARSARIEELQTDEEVGNFEVALVVEGWVSVMPTIADFAAAMAQVGDVVFTTGTIDEPVTLRVVAGQDGTKVAVWDRSTLEQAMNDCPWVADELKEVADRFQALGGATMGPLGERLDDSLRATVTEKLEVRSFGPGDEIVAEGKPVPGLHIVGAGRVELVREGEVEDEMGPGDFLFAETVLAQGAASATARAGEGGALILFGERMVAHELLVSVPPLIEILSGS